MYKHDKNMDITHAYGHCPRAFFSKLLGHPFLCVIVKTTHVRVPTRVVTGHHGSICYPFFLVFSVSFIKNFRENDMLT